MSVLIEPERKRPAAGMVDVLVAGGSPAGLVAAIAAARAGAETLLVERYCYLGLPTGGFAIKPQASVVGGIAEEMSNRTGGHGGLIRCSV